MFSPQRGNADNILAWQSHTMISEILELVRTTENVEEIDKQNIFPLEKITKFKLYKFLTNENFYRQKFGTRGFVVVGPLAPVVVV